MKILSDITSLSGKGYTLIEASAGTGKTFTITGIYLRLVMEEGLLPEQILVVTFTRAATEELKAKLRRRIEDALDFLESENAPDDVLQRLVRHALDDLEIGRQELERRLKLALGGMDQAAVYTIHGFCQRILQEYPLEVGSSASGLEVVMDEELHLPGIMDFLRTRLADLDERHLDLILELFEADKLVSGLQKMLNGLLTLPEPRIIPDMDLEAFFKEHEVFRKRQERAAASLASLAEAVAKVQTEIPADLIDELKGILLAAGKRKTGSKIDDLVEKWLKQEVELLGSLAKDLLPNDAVFERAAAILPAMVFCSTVMEGQPFLKVWLYRGLEELVSSKKGRKSKLDRATRQLYMKALHRWMADEDRKFVLNGQSVKEISGLFQDFIPLFHHYGIRSRLEAALMCELRRSVKDYMKREKARAGAISFDDMVTRVYEALGASNGRRLSKIIRNRYPVALIDEFQDTDALQWRIFRAIYPDPEKSRLFLIGDPKQAIYGFRGADIFTYLKAKRHVKEDSRYDLKTNWRSSPELVNGINEMFSIGDNPFILDGIDFVQVDAREENRFHLHVKSARGRDEITRWESAMEIWLANLDGICESDGQSQDDHKKRGGPDPAEATAAKIAQILELARKKELVFKGADGSERRVDDGDIAVLVRTHRQADKIRQALYQFGIPAVLQGPSNVYTSMEARELLYILAAVFS
ncbi:MAG: UvrD-helicase domain-containing protein, partial [Thermodesulfobacteria bacterium]|nr:UvrD-helicase domain-containing protein [Thermodesulfobacteriota bacterium]